MTAIRHLRPLAAAGPAVVLLGVLLAVATRAARPPPTVTILNPAPGTVASPAPVSPASGGFKVQIQVWNDVDDISSVSVGHCPTTSDPALQGSWAWSTASWNSRYDCGTGCAMYEVELSGLTSGLSYFLQARADSASDGIGTSADGRQGDARYLVVRVLPAGAGTGTLLVRDSSSQLCLDCHALRTHGSQASGAHYGNWALGCRECHTPHGTTNVGLVNESVRSPTTGAQKIVRFYGPAGDAPNSYVDSSAGADTTAVCQACHTRTRSRTKTPRWRSSGNSDPEHWAAGGPNGSARCTDCHTHDGGFSHGRGAPCNSCHGHDQGWNGNQGFGKGTFQSHSTHTEDDADDRRGPAVGCGVCHEVPNFPFFRSGTDADGDGWIDLTETDVCDGCHSAGGAYDGVGDPVIGAKASWRAGAYDGNSLRPGKERWCVGCHDGGTSVIPTSGGRQAPDIARNGASLGYYVTGHGSRGEECAGCHDVTLSHNFDGARTYVAASDNYRQGYRLAGARPMNIPKVADGTCEYDRNDFALCYSCHDEQSLLEDTQPNGVYECATNPYRNAAAITTGFRNVSVNGQNGGEMDVPANIHWDHLVDVHTLSFGGYYWDSDYDGTLDSKNSCVTCHNPHGAAKFDGVTPTVKMTRAHLDLETGTDATGEFGMAGAASNFRCFSCHIAGSLARYYKTAPAALRVSGAVTLADVDPTPAAAESGYTNARTVRATLDAYASPTEMILAEDNAFTVNSTGWIPFIRASTYTLTDSDGPKSVYARVRNALGQSDVRTGTVRLDRISPTVPATAVTSPNGLETWDQGTSHDVTWGGVSDANLKASPIELSYSTDGGATYPHGIATGEANDGTYSWVLPFLNNTTVRVRLSATDRAGNQSSDTSDQSFTIRALVPLVSGLIASDADGADPTPAEAGFTNARAVEVSLSGSNFPVEMILAEDDGFTQNSTGWLPYATSHSYVLSAGDGAKTIWLKLRNAAGESDPASFSITLDTAAPTVAPDTLIAPNGGELWQEGGSAAIAWAVGRISDPNLKASPVALELSRDSGAIFGEIAADLANTGSYPWNPVPEPASLHAVVRLTARDRAGNRSSDLSDGVFRITTPYVVTNTADSGPGSLRQVLTDLVAAGGNDTIWFDVPSGLTNGVAVIALASNLPDVSAPNIVVDATSQTVIRGDTNARGPEVRLHGWGYLSNTSRGLNITAAGAVVRGFQITNTYEAVTTNADGARIAGNHIGFYSDAATGYTASGNRYVNVAGGYAAPSASNTIIGGTALEDRNYIAGNYTDGYYDVSGIHVGYYTTNTSIINNFIGLTPSGSAMDNGNQYAPIVVNGNSCLIQGNQISGSSAYGVEISSGTGTTIRGNVFGLYYDGAAWNARNAPGSAVGSSWGVGGIVIGGPAVAGDDDHLDDSNVIASRAGTGNGIRVAHDPANPTKIFGNFIGTNPEQDEVFSGSIGIYLTGSARATKIGGSGAGEAGNVIAHMSTRGVHVTAGAAFADIRNNSFHDNGTEAGESDDAIFLEPGANDWPTAGVSLSRPSISAATTSLVTVDGVEAGNAVEVYVSDYDGAGTEYGEGRTLVGTAVSAGTSVAVPVAGVAAGQWVTATRTSFYNTFGNTSPFSANVQVQ